MQITVLPPYWQRWWFKSIAAAAFTLVLILFYRRKVTQLKKEKLIQQEFSRQQIVSQDLARKRLAADLHDGLAQDLLVASNELQQFLHEGNGSKKDLAQAAGLVQESIHTVREISSNLHPHHLDRLGFGSAVEAMTENLARTPGLVIHTSLDNIDKMFGKETEVHLYRIIQEALTNVVRHASARNVGVIVKRDQGKIEIVITDDGKGFDPDAAVDCHGSPSHTERLHGFGLASMSERARIIGGIIKIESLPGKGTTVNVTLSHTSRGTL